VRQPGESVTGEERFVIVRHKRGNIQTRPIGQKNTWTLAAGLAKSDQLHRINPILGAACVYSAHSIDWHHEKGGNAKPTDSTPQVSDAKL
jgi:hypothetical protein